MDSYGREAMGRHLGQVCTTFQAASLLNRVNKTVNGAIEQITNFDHWGTTLDYWDYPVDGKGDCKIYALYKRKLLLQAAFHGRRS